MSTQFFDNVQQKFSDKLRSTLNNASCIDICVGYFNLGGWLLIDDLVRHLSKVGNPRCRIIVGIKPTEAKLYETLSQGFFPTKEDRLIAFGNQISTGDIAIRFTRNYKIHSKLYLIYKNRHDIPYRAFLGSSNLTYSGLSGTPGELNAEFGDHENCSQLKDWFEQQWDSSHVEDFSEKIIGLIQDNSSRFIADFIENLVRFLTEWEIDYLEVDGKFHYLNLYISFNPKEGEYDISPEFETFIKNLIQNFGASNIYLPYDSNPNCETLRDIINCDKSSEDYWEKSTWEYAQYQAQKDD